MKFASTILFGAAVAQDNERVAQPGDGDKRITNGRCNKRDECFGNNGHSIYRGDCYCDMLCVTVYNDCCQDMKYQCFQGDEICVSKYEGTPDSGCFTQSETWYPGQAVTCSMDNEDCLEVDCDSSSISAHLRHDLFHTNLEDANSIMDQFVSGDRTLYVNGKKADYNAPCGFTVDSDGVRLNWDYEACDVKPTMTTSDQCKGDNDNAVKYTLHVFSEGNSGDEDDTIEFYVDSTIDASCTYCANFLVDADGFYVNQEDMVGSGGAMGDLSGLFDCKFYADRARRNEIKDHNIVNMGEQLYGAAHSKGNGGYGLHYKLVNVKFSDTVGDGELDVIKGSRGNKLVDAKTQKTAPVGERIKFRFMSFGFEDHTDQNFMDAQCKLKVYVDNPLERTLDPAEEGFGNDDYE